MNIQDMLITMDQTAEASEPTLFPFPLSLHLAFVCIGVIFFAYRFYTQKKPYQLLVAAAIAVSLGFWISESKIIYYGIGIIQVLLLIAALVTSFIFKDKTPETSDEESDVTAEEDESAQEEPEEEASEDDGDSAEEEK